MKLKKIAKYFAIGVFAFVGYGVGYYHLSDEFGQRMSESDVEKYLNSPNFNGEAFENNKSKSIDVLYDKSDSANSFLDWIMGIPDNRPIVEMPHRTTEMSEFMDPKKNYTVAWMGHSTIALRINQSIFLIDPVFEDKTSPHPSIGSSRYSESLPFEIDDLPYVSFVLISHDHYDHLSMRSVERLKDKAQRFIVPLGVDRHLVKWGVNPSKIDSLDWWDKKRINGIDVTLAPSKHFSGRSLQRNDTLWGSWHIKTEEKTIYFSGDTGYGDHFKKIRERLGPVDFAFMECGQYSLSWRDIHMMPQESVKAAQDLDAKIMMPVHWGAFSLSTHTWYHPVEMATREAERLGQELIVPEIGQVFSMSDVSDIDSGWWKSIPREK